jgi:polysaccharide pyruvyl transferase WcaK-like protein
MFNKSNLLVLNDTRFEQHHGCSRVMNCIDFYANKYAKNVEYLSLNEDWQTSESAKQKIIFADIIIVNGEGTIHHNAQRGLSLIKVASFAKHYQSKCYLINMTYQENPQFYCEYLKDFEAIYVRESYSYNELKALNIDSRVVADLTFSFEPSQKKDSSSNQIVITDSVITSITQSLIKKFVSDHNTLFSSIFNYNTTKTSKLTFTSRVVNVIKNNNYKTLLNKFRSYFFDECHKDLWVIQHCHTDYASFLSQAEVVLCGRFHAMTICLNNEIAFLAIESNSHKISGTLADIGLDLKRFIVTPESISNDFLINFKYSESEKLLIKNYSRKAKKDIKSMFENIFLSS